MLHIINQRNIQAKEGHFDGAIIDGVCGNMLRVGRGRQPCGTNLKTAVRYPYRPISTWLIDLITRFRVYNLFELGVYNSMHHL